MNMCKVDYPWGFFAQTIKLYENFNKFDYFVSKTLFYYFLHIKLLFLKNPQTFRKNLKKKPC